MSNNGNVSAREVLAKAGARSLRVPPVPVEWYGSNCWRLPSGKALAEFALQAGFLAPPVFQAEGLSCTGLSSLRSASSRPSQALKKAGGA